MNEAPAYTMSLRACTNGPSGAMSTGDNLKVAWRRPTLGQRHDKARRRIFLKSM